MKTLLLPGMDGGAKLSEEFRQCLGDGAEALPYPSDEVLGYAELEDRVRARLAKLTAPVMLIAESFSGPIAISIAASPPPNLKRLVLVATFDRPPAPSFLAPFIRDLMFRRAPPALFIRTSMLGEGATDEDVERVQEAIRRVDGTVLANRLRAVLRVDVREKSAAIQLPVLRLAASKDRLVRRALTAPSTHWRAETIDGPHLLLQQRPGECAEAIQRCVATDELPF
jgi:pimeloyl-ACP methyl ester carboxylesterase